MLPGATTARSCAAAAAAAAEAAAMLPPQNVLPLEAIWQCSTGSLVPGTGAVCLSAALTPMLRQHRGTLKL